MTSDDNGGHGDGIGGESWREAVDARRRADGGPARDTPRLVINLSAKAQETARYGPVRSVTRWHGALPKTASDLHGRARNGT